MIDRAGVLSSLNPAVGLTLTGLSFGVAAAAAALAGEPELGLVALIVAGICDLFDGRVARQLDLDEGAKELGVQLDSLADMASFGVVPGLLVAATCDGPVRWLALLTAIPYAACAAMRLAHFNLSGMSESGSTPYYRGMPVTYAALVLPLTYVVARLVAEPWIGPILIAALGACALLFVSGLPVRKPSGPLYAIFPVVALAVIGALLAWRFL